MVLNQPTSPCCVSKISRAIRDAAQSTNLQTVIQTIGDGLPRVARFHAFLEDLIELRFERVNLSDARRARRHPLGLLVSALQEIEIKSAIRNFLAACESLFRNGEQRKARRQRQR